MSKADHYHSRAELCDRHAAGTSKELREIWRIIADQYRFLEGVERRTADPMQHADLPAPE